MLGLNGQEKEMGEKKLVLDTLIDGGALRMAINALRRAGKMEIADELVNASRRVEGVPPHTVEGSLERAMKETLSPCDCGCGRSCCAFCGMDLGFVSETYPPLKTT